MSRALRRDPASLDAWDELLRGLFHLWQYTRESNAEARVWLERAMRSDPGFAAPVVFLGLSHLNDLNAGWAEDPRRSGAQAIQLARRAVAMDPRDPHGPALLGGMLAVFGEKQEALTLLGDALAANPSFAWGHWALGRGLSLWGRPDEAIAHLDAARRLSPRDPLLAHFHEGLAFAHFARGDAEGALASARESVRLRPDWPRVHHVLCASASAAGEGEAARRARAQALSLGERRTLVDLRHGFERAGAEREFVERYIGALAEAGWA
jgi:tetratricopeptide (TPR) repeat protein